MSWSTREAFTDPAIRESMAFRSEFRFHLRDIPVEITLRLFDLIHAENIVVRKSHTISVPGLEPVEVDPCPDESQVGEVVQCVVSGFVRVYNAAIAKGLTPDAAWLKTNPDFC
jgi:hypothetical protein